MELLYCARVSPCRWASRHVSGGGSGHTLTLRHTDRQARQVIGLVRSEEGCCVGHLVGYGRSVERYGSGAIVIERPASTSRVLPVIQRPSSLARKTDAQPMSQALPSSLIKPAVARRRRRSSSIFWATSGV